MKPRASEQDDQVELRFLEGVRSRCPEDDRVLKALGDLYTRSGEIERGLEVDRQLTRLCPDEPDVWYNLGCSFALVGAADEAFEALNKSIELGYTNREWMTKDNDLQSIRSDPRFQTLLKRLRA